MAISAKHDKTSFNVGDTIIVKHKFVEEGKTLSQTFVGIVISIKGRGKGKTFTVRKIAADSVGVEKIWPLHSPNITKITVRKKGNPRRAKLYYLRQRKGKLALRVKTKN